MTRPADSLSSAVTHEMAYPSAPLQPALPIRISWSLSGPEGFNSYDSSVRNPPASVAPEAGGGALAPSRSALGLGGRTAHPQALLILVCRMQRVHLLAL
jgi:hypothetical protein